MGTITESKVCSKMTHFLEKNRVWAFCCTISHQTLGIPRPRDPGLSNRKESFGEANQIRIAWLTTRDDGSRWLLIPSTTNHFV